MKRLLIYAFIACMVAGCDPAASLKEDSASLHEGRQSRQSDLLDPEK